MQKSKLQSKIQNWRKVKLGEVLEFKYGFGLPEKERKSGTVPVYGSSGIVGFHDNPAVNRPGIIVGRKGNVGAVHYSKIPFYPIDTVYFIDETKQNTDLHFLYYLLSRIPFKQVGSDVGVPGLNRNIAYQLEVNVPEDPAIQKRIAGVLSAFDEKIEVNNKISKNLEEMAQAIFKEWFVDFRLSRYKKTKFVNSELGKIPKGWEVKKITEIIKRLPVGKKYDNKNALPKGEIPILDQGQSGFIGYHDGEPGVRASIESPVAVFTNHTCYYRLMTQNFSCIQNVIPYIGDKGYPTLFVYFLTKGKIKMQEYKGHWPEFEEQIFTIPPVSFAQKFSDYIQPIIKKMVGVEKENQKLAALRDLLLPKLMSGEIKL